MAEEKSEAAVPNGIAATKHRSPNYPAISLRKAVDRAKEVYEKYKRNVVPINLVQELWRYKAYSGAGNQVVAALKAYGLLEVEGDGKNRRLSISDAAYRIIQNSPDRVELLKRAALKPPLHAELWQKYQGEGLPDDDIIRQYLVLDRGEVKFNPDVVDSFIADFRDSLRLAGYQEGEITETPGELVSGIGSKRNRHPIQIGDYVQWNSQGVDQFAEPKRVLGFSDDGAWAFVEGGLTGVSVSDLVLQNQRIPPPVGPPANPFLKATDDTTDAVCQQPVSEEEKTNLPDGPVLLRWPKELSPESVEELEYWMKGLIRKARRKAGIPQTEK